MEEAIHSCLPVKQTGPTRQARLRSWMALHSIEQKDLAEAIGVSETMISHIVYGRQAPSERIEQLIAFGVPRDLLPEPRPKKRSLAERVRELEARLDRYESGGQVTAA